MQPEIEVKFLNTDHKQIREKLHAAGAVCKSPQRLMRRAIIDYPDRRMQTTSATGWGWVRVRDEGDQVSCTYKHIAPDDTTHEIEFTVSSYDQAVALFEAIGLKVHSVQETKRESWELDDASVELDEWPWIPPYVEIEAPTEASVRKAAERLGFDWKTAEKGSADRVYRIYYPKMKDEESVSDLPLLTFDLFPDYLKERR